MKTKGVIYWEILKKECHYPEDYNRDGFIYGVEYYDEDGEIIDIVWFKTEQEQLEEMQHD